ncbi:hypothetical protein EPI10_024082 [Gossypium australe]|uniref:Uncharacterized protein n=1 Tax=Gossypium australe TaxID=47621 RepID=A0A5B6VXA4_9ROSI|nr:hypothetical protein EPI10_024082 [Gossypium australe]
MTDVGLMSGGGSVFVPTGTSVLVTHRDYGHQRFGTSRGLAPHSDLSLWLTPPWQTRFGHRAGFGLLQNWYQSQHGPSLRQLSAQGVVTPVRMSRSGSGRAWYLSSPRDSPPLRRYPTWCVASVHPNSEGSVVW